MARLKTLFRRLRTILWTALTLVVILAAVLVGVGKLLMPYSDRYQSQLEEWLSREFQQPVVIESFTGEWKAFGPRISFRGVKLLGDGKGEGEIAIQHAALDIKPLNALLPNRPLYSFRIIGADLALIRTPDGRYELSGLGVSGRNSGQSDYSGLRNLTKVGEVRLEDSSLSFDDDERNIHIQLTGIKGRLQINDREFSTELEANISDANKTRVLGDLKATLLITLGEDQHLSSANWHVKTGELMISELARQLPDHDMIPRSGWLNAEIWGEWSLLGSQVMAGVIDLRESTLFETPQLLQMDHLNTRFRWNFHDRTNWRIDLSDLKIEADGEEWETDRLSIERNISGNLGIWVSSDFINIEFPLQLTQRIMSSYNSSWPRLMPRQIRGQVHDFDLVLDSRWKLFQLSGELDKIDAWQWDQYPDVAGISGSIDLLGGEGEIEFSGESVSVNWPKNFRRPAVVDIPSCAMEIIWGEPGEWQLDVRNCVIENENFAISGRSRIAGNEGKPEMDLNIVISRANLAELDDFWPRSLMSPTVSDWLSKGIVNGRSAGGRFMLRGDMDDWPFSQGEGILLASVAISDAELDYVEAWPHARNIDMTLNFRGVSMVAQGSIGDMGGAAVQQVTARIGDFKHPVLEMDYRARVPMPDLMEFIKSTPMLDDVDLDLEQFLFEHTAETSGRLVAPLRSGLGELTINGRLRLLGNSFTEVNSGIALHDLKGDISYDREGLRASSLTALFRQHPAAISLLADWDGDEVFSAELGGVFPIEDLLPEPLIQAEPLLTKFSGSSHWDIRLSVKSGTGSSERETWLDMSSDLIGVSMDFPAPLNKQAEEKWPATVRYPIKNRAPLMTIAIEDKATMLFELREGSTDPRRANISFGVEAGNLPAEGLFSISGSTPVFDLDQWMDVVIERFTQTTPGEGLIFDKVSLATDEMRFLNRAFHDVKLNVQYENEVLVGNVESAGIAGEVRYTRSDDGSHSLSAVLDRLIMPDPIDQGMSMDTDPSSLPEMHLYVREFNYMGLDLGETRIEAYPIQNGLRIDSVEAVSPQLNFQARGDWIRDDNGSRSDFDILITSESIGSLMNLMGISSVLEGGQTLLSYDAWWPGPPAAFALAQLNGEISISVSDGRILNADAGAGRIVGLLSISALPRRLALDFRDVFGSGFSFDQASGTITLENGMAYTQDLVLESTAATMTITGNSDLVNNQFDYLMTVRPGVSQTLPAIGAVIAGPGGAAAGLALAGLLRKSLGDATEAQYTIRGPWSSPTVEPVRTATSTDDGTEK